jgi:hypothetical protein
VSNIPLTNKMTKLVIFFLIVMLMMSVSKFVPPKTPNYTEIDSWAPSTLSEDKEFAATLAYAKGYIILCF